MDFDEYSNKAALTDQTSFKGREKLQFLALGLNEEAGEIARLIKKSMRNDISIEHMKSELKRKLGDVLWYLSRFGTEAGLKFSEVAEANIEHTKSRWLSEASNRSSSHAQVNSGAEEKFPDYLTLTFKRVIENDLIKLHLQLPDGSAVGDIIDDNSRSNDGYRFHDVIHLAFMANLGWSPVLRKLLKIKRKSDPKVDRVEDGARAGDIEEAISTLIFVYLQDNNFLDGAKAVDTSFLSILRSITRDREVAHATEREWELAMLNAALMIRQLKANDEGQVMADNVAHQLTFMRMPE